MLHRQSTQKIAYISTPSLNNQMQPCDFSITMPSREKQLAQEFKLSNSSSATLYIPEVTNANQAIFSNYPLKGEHTWDEVKMMFDKLSSAQYTVFIITGDQFIAVNDFDTLKENLIKDRNDNENAYRRDLKTSF